MSLARIEGHSLSLGQLNGCSESLERIRKLDSQMGVAIVTAAKGLRLISERCLEPDDVRGERFIADKTGLVFLHWTPPIVTVSSIWAAKAGQA